MSNALLSEVAAASISVFLPREFAPGALGASIVDICSETTLWALQCTNATTFLIPTGSQSLSVVTTAPASASCGPNAPTMTITEGNGILAFTTQFPSAGATVSVYESCTFPYLYNATCYAASTIVASRSTISATATTTYNSVEVMYNLASVNITAGASQLTATGKCHVLSTPSSIPTSAAAPIKRGASGLLLLGMLATTIYL